MHFPLCISVALMMEYSRYSEIKKAEFDLKVLYKAGSSFVFVYCHSCLKKYYLPQKCSKLTQNNHLATFYQG